MHAVGVSKQTGTPMPKSAEDLTTHPSAQIPGAPPSDSFNASRTATDGFADTSRGAQMDGGDAASAQRETHIREAAYRRYQQRGDAAGDSLSDWLAAESEIDAADADGQAGVPSADAAVRAEATPARSY